MCLWLGCLHLLHELLIRGTNLRTVSRKQVINLLSVRIMVIASEALDKGIVVLLIPTFL